VLLVALDVALGHNGCLECPVGDFFYGLRQIRDELKGSCMLDERDVMNRWRSLFDGQIVTSDSLAKAETLLEDFSGESPLHIRLAKELKEIQLLQQKKPR
jgi:hypothetical protein